MTTPPRMGQPPEGQVYTCRQCGQETDEYWLVEEHGMVFCSNQCALNWEEDYLGGDSDDDDGQSDSG